ncbi:carboxypeptidase-like regulatory domain-containing protein [Aeoliella sp. SH292]|uniref:carboxypeptidase-like regulatory domain-containing protein n=1 Tax=Aeoliella sp. SH292 TaxID=3454464 RepID=UPI003F98E3BC
MMVLRFAACVGYMLVLAAVVGCGPPDGQMAVYPVSGSVTVAGQPAAGAKVTLIGLDEKFSDPKSPIPSATVAEDGSFEITSYTSGDGAPDGNYRVVILWEEAIPENADPESAPAPKDKLGGKYNHDKSELKVTIPAESTTLPPFEL